MIGVVCRLRRIQSSRYEIGLQIQSAEAADLTYTSLVRPFYSFSATYQSLIRFVAIVNTTA